MGRNYIILYVYSSQVIHFGLKARVYRNIIVTSYGPYGILQSWWSFVGEVWKTLAWRRRWNSQKKRSICPPHVGMSHKLRANPTNLSSRFLTHKPSGCWEMRQMMTSHPQEQSLNTPPSHIMCIHNYNLIISPQCTTQKWYSTPHHHPLFSLLWPVEWMLAKTTTRKPTTKTPVAPATFAIRFLGDKKHRGTLLGSRGIEWFRSDRLQFATHSFGQTLRSLGVRFGSVQPSFFFEGFPEEDVYIYILSAILGMLENGPVFNPEGQLKVTKDK